MIATKSYIALDLEMNQPSGKIIQVGVAVGSYDDYVNNSIQTYHYHINPEEPISTEITALTGITDTDIKLYSNSYAYVAECIESLMVQNSCFINPVTWGGDDSQLLIKEFADRDIQFQTFGRRWIDVKTWYVMDRIVNGKSPSGGLKSAMGTLSKNKLQFQGTPHRADVDALNTLRLFFYMLDRQDKLENILKLIKTI